jgi:hypothetical protein
MEGGIVFNLCVKVPPACPLSESCPVQRAWSGATRHAEDHLASVRFDELATGPEKLAAETGYVRAIESSVTNTDGQT